MPVHRSDSSPCLILEPETTPQGPVLSMNPVIKGDLFRWERGVWDQELARQLSLARAVIVPQTVSCEMYSLSRDLCPRVFPNYDQRFRWQGKVGDTLLFWSQQVLHPRTQVFPRVESLLGEHPEMGVDNPALPPYPFVLKAALGGEGHQVWLIENRMELDKVLALLKRLEWGGSSGFVIQEYLPGLERDLRVVVIGERVRSYWRYNPKSFHKNVAQGGELDHHADPELQEAGRQAVVSLCARTGINLAGFDMVFPTGTTKPHFLEINYTFGRAGLGGSEAFYAMLQAEVDRWLARQ